MTIFKHALKRSFSQSINIIVIFILPLVSIFIPGEGETFPNGMSLYGMINLFSAFLLCKSITEDRTNNITLRIFSSPIKFITYFSSYLLAYTIILTIQNIIFVIGIFIYWDDAVFNYGLIFLLYLFYSFMTISFSLFWNSLFKSYNLSFALFSGFGSVMCLLSGISIPIQLIPDKLKNIIQILPTYWLPSGLDAIYNGKMDSVLLSFTILIIFSGIFLLIGSRRRY